MMLLECPCPIRHVTCRSLFCPHDNAERKGLLSSSHVMDEETGSGKLSDCHMASLSGRARIRIQGLWLVETWSSQLQFPRLGLKGMSPGPGFLAHPSTAQMVAPRSQPPAGMVREGPGGSEGPPVPCIPPSCRPSPPTGLPLCPAGRELPSVLISLADYSVHGEVSKRRC